MVLLQKALPLSIEEIFFPSAQQMAWGTPGTESISECARGEPGQEQGWAEKPAVTTKPFLPFITYSASDMLGQ